MYMIRRPKLSDSKPFLLPAEPRPEPRRIRGQDEEEGGQEVQKPRGPAQLRAADHEAAQHVHLGEAGEGPGRGDDDGDPHDSAGGFWVGGGGAWAGDRQTGPALRRS